MSNKFRCVGCNSGLVDRRMLDLCRRCYFKWLKDGSNTGSVEWAVDYRINLSRKILDLLRWYS